MFTYICTGLVRLVTAPNQIPIQFNFYYIEKANLLQIQKRLTNVVCVLCFLKRHHYATRFQRSFKHIKSK